MTEPTVEEIVARIERCDALFGDDGWHVNRGELEPLIASWRKRGEALKKARPVVEAHAELAVAHNLWAQGIPLNALDAIDAALK